MVDLCASHMRAKQPNIFDRQRQIYVGFTTFGFFLVIRQKQQKLYSRETSSLKVFSKEKKKFYHIPVLQQDKNALFISFLLFTYIIIIIFSQEGEGQAFVPCCVI